MVVMLNFLLKLVTGGIGMIDLYVALIIAGRRTIDQVPAKYKEAVTMDLKALGLDGSGNPI